MNAVGLFVLAIVLFLVLTGPPSRALVGMMAGVLYLTQVQQFNIAGFNLYAFRFVEIAGFVRVMGRGEFSFSHLSRIDKVLLGFVAYTVVVYALRTTEGLVYRIGWGVDTFLCYFTFRGLVSDTNQFKLFLKTFSILLVTYASLVTIESVLRINLLSIVGGRTAAGDMIREGRLRASGGFRHPSLLGTLGASFLPLYIGLAFDKTLRNRAIVGAAACAVIVWASNSGGPASGALVAIVGWLAWCLRKQMKWVRWSIALSLIALALVMKAPIWYLIARVSSITGGDGWHRSRLMEQAFNHLDGWWLAGMPLEATQNWFPYYIHGTGGADITNQFIVYGIASGLGSMALFFLLLITAFRAVSAALRYSSESSDTDRYLFWGCGIVLCVHMFTWIGISYFDQTYAIWYLQLALISAIQPVVRSSLVGSFNNLQSTERNDEAARQSFR